MNLIDKVNPKLKKYVEEKVFPMYDLNGESHGKDHINQVIRRTFEIIEEYERNNPDKKTFNYDLAYVIAAYHDIGDHIDRRNHHIVSAKIMYEDENLNEFFSQNEKQIAKEAIEDHRASNSKVPRTMYGQVVLTADRNDNLEDFFIRRIQCCMERHPEYNSSEVIEEVYTSSIKKFGKEGYAVKKNCYMPCEKLEAYLKEINRLLQNREEFEKLTKQYYEKIQAEKTGKLPNSIELPEDLKIQIGSKLYE